MRDLWHPWFHRLCNAVYFDRVTVVHPERLPPAGPVLYLGLHRNGAVDGFVYHGVRPRAVFMLSRQLRQNVIGRMFFCGIEVTREKDRAADGAEDETNARALTRCAELLGEGGELFVFPEGTSTLGPRHLPFKSGAARLVNDALERGRPLRVVPLGLHYDCAWEFRSRVEVVVGPEISTDFTGCATPLERLKVMKRRIQGALEDVGVNVASDAEWERVQRLAYAATLGTERSYYGTLKALEKGVPARVVAAWSALEPELKARKLWYFQGVPLYPLGSVGGYALALAVTAPLVALAILLNLPPFLAATWAGRKFPDGRNVVSLWRLLIGLPAFMLWTGGVALTALACGGAGWLAGYAAVTVTGLWLYRRVKKLAVAVHNSLRVPELAERVRALRALLLTEVPHA
jgi:1-acyl-sn-glycerol-3-phosphate acyltransferase